MSGVTPVWPERCAVSGRAPILCAGAFVCALTFCATVARAEGAQDKAAADVLFAQGKKLMHEGNYAEACPKFAESLRLDPGIGAMLWLADCYERQGKTASAWGEFQEAAETAARQKDGREKVARQHAAALEPKLVRLKVLVPPASDVSGLEIKRDDSVLGRPEWGTALPVDPGAHVVRASAPGFKEWTTTVEAKPETKALTVSVPKLEPAPAGQAESAGNAGDRKRAGDWPLQRTLALVAVGAGVVSVGAGAVFGFQAKSKLDDSNADGHCRADDHCDAIGVQLRSDAKDAATMSTIFFAAGGALIAGGAVLWFTAPTRGPATRSGSRVRVAPAIGRTGGGINVGGAF